MESWKIYVVGLVPIIGVGLVFKYLVRTNKIKPNIVSKLFYDDDKSFINYWKREEEKGFLRYTLKNISISTAIMIVTGLFAILNKRSMYGYEQSQILVVALTMGVVMGLIGSLIGWIGNQVRERRILEKAMAESDKIHTDN